MSHALILLKTLFSRRWIVVTLVVLAGMAFLARLGVWQLDRLQQRRATNAALQAALDTPPFVLTGDLSTNDWHDLKDHKVVVQGVFDFERQIILKVQNWQGRPGVHLITPLLIDGSDTAVLVDRGWIPDSEYQTGTLSRFEETGSVTVNGFIALSQTLSRSNNGRGQSTTAQKEVYRVDIDMIQPQMPYIIYPIYISQAPLPEGNVNLPFRVTPDIDLSEGPHLSYALQWFTFCIMLGVIYIIYVNKSLNALPNTPVQTPS